MLDVMFNGLDNNDGVVDYQADSEDEANRESVSIEKPSIGDCESANERNRHGEERDKRGAPILEKQEDHDDDEDDGLKERSNDFIPSVTANKCPSQLCIPSHRQLLSNLPFAL